LVAGIPAERRGSAKWILNKDGDRGNGREEEGLGFE